MKHKISILLGLDLHRTDVQMPTSPNLKEPKGSRVGMMAIWNIGRI